jgi:hypothetical protein
VAICVERERLRKDALESLALIALEADLSRVEGKGEAQYGLQTFDSQLEAVETSGRGIAH